MNVAFNKKICGGKITKLEKRKSKLKLSVNWIKNTANYEKNCKILQETVQRRGKGTANFIKLATTKSIYYCVGRSYPGKRHCTSLQTLAHNKDPYLLMFAPFHLQRRSDKSNVEHWAFWLSGA
jgi:hypothetical protein